LKNKKILPIIFAVIVVISIQHILSINNNETEPYPEQVGIPGPDTWPSEWIWMQRTFPYGEADSDAYTYAINYAHTLRKSKQSITVPWQFIGPTNIGGRIVDIEFDPNNPQIVYAAAATGGIFKSTDTGLTWSAIFDDQSVLSMGDLAIDPNNSQILYAGTGEANGGHNNFPGGGIYKSHNGGLNWQYSGLESTRSIGRVLINPENTNQVFVAAVGSYFGPDPSRGVFRSDDGGQTWEHALFVSDSTGAIDLAMDPENPSFLMAAMWERVRRPVHLNGTHLYGQSSGIYRSFDGGENWEKLGAEHGLPNTGTEPIGRIGLAMFPQNSDSVYALFNDGSTISGLYLSPDRGDHWHSVDINNNLAEGTGGFSWYFGQVRIHPTQPDIVFVLDVALMRSVNGGLNFPFIIRNNNFDLHVDHHALAFHPNNSDYIIDGNDGGINISEDGGETWIKAESLPVTQFYEIGIDPQNPNRFYGGTQDNGTIGTNTGLIDDWEGILGGDGFYVILDPVNPNIIYAESQFGNLYKIENDSYTFLPTSQMMDDSRNWSTPVVMSPDDNQVLYYGTNKIYRTVDGGMNWSAISTDLTRNLPDSRIGTITTISVAPSNSAYIYAGTDDGLIWISPDNGISWEDVTGDSLPFRWITRVQVDPLNEHIVYATFSGLKWKEAQAHVFRSADAGKTWENISGNLPDAPVNAFAIDPKNPNTLFCGTDVGVYVSFDLGKNWNALGNKIPVVVINDMKIDNNSRQLVVGTHGRSMFTIDIDAVSDLHTLKEKMFIPGVVHLLQNYPNPFNSATTFEFVLNEPGSVELLIYDALGRNVYQLGSGQLSTGKHKLRWNGFNSSGNEVASGVYFYQIILHEKFSKSNVRKLLLLR